MRTCCNDNDSFDEDPDDYDLDLDEDPSDEDVERLDGDTAWCPSCGAEIWEDSAACPKCGDMIETTLVHRPRHHRPSQQKLTSVTAIILIVAMLAGCALFGALRLF